MDNPKLTIQATGDKQKAVAGIQPRRSHLLRVSKRKTMNDEQTRQGFTLVELMIVVAILGILAAIVFPQFQGHIQKAKEAAAKDNLRILREVIERYAAEHNGVPPGYPNGISSTPTSGYINEQLINKTNVSGAVYLLSNPELYPFGPYLNELPKNPINDAKYIYLFEGASFPELPVINITSPIGWVFNASTRELRINLAGTDSEGIDYSEY